MGYFQSPGLNTAPRPPIEFNPLLSKPLNDLIMKTLEKDPAKRFQSVGAFSDALYEATGIAASTPIQRGPFVAPTGTVSVGRPLPITPAAATSHFSIDTHRRSWIAAAVLAVLGIPVLIAAGLPHFAKTWTIAKAPVHSVTPSAPLPGSTHEELGTTVSGQNAPTAPGEPHLIFNGDSAPVPATATTQRKAFATAVSSSRHKRAREPERFRVKYQHASRPEVAPKTKEMIPRNQARL